MEAVLTGRPAPSLKKEVISLKLCKLPAVLLSCAALLAASAGCAGPAEGSDGKIHAVAATYPVYALAAAVSAGSEGVALTRLDTGQVSCLHDYTLTVSDARRLERADLLLLSGAGLEEFLSSALEGADAAVVDCSASLPLLEADDEDHHHGDHGGEEDTPDPHYWMDPRNAASAALTIGAALSRADQDNAALYQDNASRAAERLLEAYRDWAGALQGLSCPYLITFHDGFRYFAQAFDLTLLFAMEEEDGATASAKDIRAASALVKEYSLPAVFMETNGSGSAARAVAGETGCAVSSLSMLMDGPAAPEGDAEEVLAALYLAPMGQNVETLLEELS